MKNQILQLFCISTIFLFSCNSKNEYKYIEIVEEKQLFGNGFNTKEKDAKIIMAESDSLAYLKAFEDFCISIKVNKDMFEAMGTSAYKPISFRLINETGIDIINTISIQGKEELEKDIESRIFSLKNSIIESVDKSEKDKIQKLKETTVIDSVKIEELERYFDVKKDEFDPQGIVWHTPKSAPKYANSNGIYCYFQSTDGIVSNFRLRVQYSADNWLFFDKIQFSIDDKAYEYIPNDTETDSGNGGRIWEWSDEQIKSNDVELIEALANAKSAKMKLIGRQYHKVKTIENTQIRDIKRALEYYKAMGGRL